MKSNIGVLASMVTLALVAVACADGEGFEADSTDKQSYDASEYAPRESTADNAVKEKEKGILEGKGSATVPFGHTHHEVVSVPYGATVSFRTHGATAAVDPVIALFRVVDNSSQLIQSGGLVDIKELALIDDGTGLYRDAAVSWTNNVGGLGAVNVHVMVFAFRDNVQKNFGDIKLSRDGGTPYDIAVTAGSMNVATSAGKIWTSGSVAAKPQYADPWIFGFAGENSVYNDDRVGGGGLESEIPGFVNDPDAWIVAYSFRDLSNGTTTVNY